MTAPITVHKEVFSFVFVSLFALLFFLSVPRLEITGKTKITRRTERKTVLMKPCPKLSK